MIQAMTLVRYCSSLTTIIDNLHKNSEFIRVFILRMIIERIIILHKKRSIRDGILRFLLATAAIVVATATVVATVTAAAEQENKNDYPSTAVTTKTIITHINKTSFLSFIIYYVNNFIMLQILLLTLFDF